MVALAIAVGSANLKSQRNLLKRFAKQSHNIR